MDLRKVLDVVLDRIMLRVPLVFLLSVIVVNTDQPLHVSLILRDLLDEVLVRRIVLSGKVALVLLIVRHLERGPS